MQKDPRFKTAGYLLTKKQMTYKSLFKHIPATVIKESLGITWARMQKIQNNPCHWNLFEIYSLAELLEITPTLLFKLIDESM